MVRDYLNGAYILVENQFAKGDVVRIAGVAGSVEDFTLRRTTLRDLDGVVHTVPNGDIKVASNLTRVWSRINQDVTVAYGTDVDKAMAVVEEVGRQMTGEPAWKRRILEAPRVERVQALGEFGITQIPGTVRAPDQGLRRASARGARRRPRPTARDPAAAAGGHLAPPGRTDAPDLPAPVPLTRSSPRRVTAGSRRADLTAG
jgi:small-conductance mechanosensitive channel